MHTRVRFLLSLFVTLLALLAVTGTALAHERRAVGPYQLVVGWIVEPAFEGQKNGVDLRVTDPVTTTPIEGVEKTLKVEITYVSTNTSVARDLRTIFRDPGHYTADILPTEPGVYRLRLFGKINDADIDETFVSRGGGGGYGDIEPIEDVQFPVKLAAAREVENAARGAQTAATSAQDTAEAAQDSASAASTVAYIGVGIGLVGLVVGASGLVMARKGR